MSFPRLCVVCRTQALRLRSNHDRIPAVAYLAQLQVEQTSRCIRHFHISNRHTAISFRDLKSDTKPIAQDNGPDEKSRDQNPRDEDDIDSADPAEQAYQRATQKARREWESQRSKSEEAGEESNGNEDKSETSKEVPPAPHGNKSPWQVFTETLSTEFKASKEWNDSTKQLASSAHQFTENESIRRARAAYSAASGAASSSTASALKSTGQVLGQGAAWTWDTSVVKGLRSGANAAGRGLDKATQPIRDTEAYKSVRNVVDDGSSSRYGGWLEKEERQRRRELRDREPKPPAPATEDPDAGTNVTVHKDSKFNERWREFKDSSPLMQSLFSLKTNYNESENPLVSTARSITDRVAGLFAENETAQVVKKFKEMDPAFALEPFLREMREYILPEVLDAYVKGDTETLQLWLSAPQYQVYAALAQQYLTAGLKSDGRVLDIRNVDILSARKLDPGDIPVFIITCRTQEVHVYRNAKTGVLAAGMEDKVQQVTYAIGVTRLPEDVNNPDTRGWRLIELQKSARDYI